MSIDPRRARRATVANWLERVGRFAESALLVALLAALIGLAATQILLRNVFDSAFIWGDELLRILVLWLAMIGAVAASRDNRHINIDVLSRFLPLAVRRVSEALVSAFTASVCGIAAWFSAAFVRDAYAFDDTVLGTLPAWPFQLVLPLGFGLIAYRYLLHLLRAIVVR